MTPTPEALAKAEHIVRRYIYSSFPELAHIDVRELPLIDSIALALTEQAREIERLTEERKAAVRATWAAAEHFFSFKLSDSHTWTVAEIKRECRARAAAQETP